MISKLLQTLKIFFNPPKTFTKVGVNSNSVSTKNKGTPQLDKSQFTIDATPDQPQGFGRKVFWFTVKADDSEQVASALRLTEKRPSNWTSGMQIAYGRNIPDDYQKFAFITPPINGWIFILSPHFYTTSDQMNTQSAHQAEAGFDLIFKTLYDAFPDVQAFGSHRGVSAMMWARAVNGEVVRMFGTVESQVTANFGVLTKEEHELNLIDISQLSTDAADKAIYEIVDAKNELEDKLLAEGMSHKDAKAQIEQQFKVDPGSDEDLHFYLAENWSISPINFESMNLSEGVGIVGELPQRMLEWPEK